MLPPNLLARLALENKALVESLCDDEKAVMFALGKTRIMRKNNFREETIRKQLPPLRKGIDVSTVCQSLNKRGILRLYRKDNWGLTETGLKIAQFFKELRFQEKYGQMRILKHA